MSEALRSSLQSALAAFATQSLREASLGFFKTLGYSSQRTVVVPKSAPRAFLDLFAKSGPFDQNKALFSDWLGADLLFQLTDQEISREVALFPGEFSAGQLRSYIFIAVELKERDYPRGKLANLARQLNRLFPTPVMVLIKHRDLVSIAVINRRQNKVHADRDVLEKVTLIRDISLSAPHRGHLDILASFAVPNLVHPQRLPIASFDALHAAWEQIFNIDLLNERFYRELANWYFWALPQVDFPADLEPDAEKRRATGLIRLLTRLIFCWFLKEKGLIPDKLFHPTDLAKLLKGFDPESETSSTYYLAILQNLFFATLNQRMGKDSNGKPYRRFAFDEGFLKNKSSHDLNNYFRYEGLFNLAPDDALALFEGIPFLNGGLFECLDKRDEDKEKTFYLDGFSRNPKKRPHIPDRLFFDSGETADLSEVYDDKKRRAEKVTGLIPILNRYKFTIVENTPIDQEIALDPELLGKVFENLLASYNEETKTTARKQTGSFYTPRPIVDYMVDESLKAHLARALVDKARMKESDARAGLDLLFAYTEKVHAFTPAEVAALIAAIDALKILDPACGSGAFPMGVLHKLVYILGKLDPDNERWKQTQLAKLDSAPMREELERAFADNNDDYGRKLYLIENCLYGVDIQPIAIQIALPAPREALLRHAQRYRSLAYDAARSEAVFAELKVLLGHSSPSSKQASDMRHVAMSAAADADVFLTRDEELLGRAPEIEERYGLQVMRPVELISRLNEAEQAALYQPSRFASTDIQKIRPKPEDAQVLAEALHVPSQQETRDQFAAKLRALLCDVQSTVIAATAEGMPLFLVAHRQVQGRREILALRCTRTALATTALRHALLLATTEVAGSGRGIIVVSEKFLSDEVQSILHELGFRIGVEGWEKITLRALGDVSAISQMLMQGGHPPLPQNATAKEIEAQYWPVKIIGADVDTWAVPIRSTWATALFETSFADEQLFRPKRELILSRENVYYSAAIQSGMEGATGRLLWYVSTKDPHQAGAKTIRACSRLLEVRRGPAKSVFNAFRRLGVYEWEQIREMVEGDPMREILALRFADTELFERPFPGEQAKALGIRNNFTSPVKVPESAFTAIYRHGMNLPISP